MKHFLKLLSVFALMLYCVVSAEAQALTSKDINTMSIPAAVNSDGKIPILGLNNKFSTTTPNVMWNSLYLGNVNALLQNYYQKGQMNTYLGQKADTSAVAKIGGMYNFNGTYTGFGLGLNQATIPTSNGIRLGYNTKQQGLGSIYPYSWSEYTDGKFLFNTKSGSYAAGRSLQDLSFENGRLIGNYYNYSPNSNSLWGGSGFEFFTNANNSATDGLVGEMNFVQKFGGGTGEEKMGLSFLRGAYDPNTYTDTKAAGNFMATSEGKAYIKQMDGTYSGLLNSTTDLPQLLKNGANIYPTVLLSTSVPNAPTVTLKSEPTESFYATISNGDYHIDQNGINHKNSMTLKDDATCFENNTLYGAQEIFTGFNLGKNNIAHHQISADSSVFYKFEIGGGMRSSNLNGGVISTDDFFAGKIEFSSKRILQGDQYTTQKRGIYLNDKIGLVSGGVENTYVDLVNSEEGIVPIASEIGFGSLILENAKRVGSILQNGSTSYTWTKGAEIFLVDSSATYAQKIAHKLIKQEDLNKGIEKAGRLGYGYEKSITQLMSSASYIPKQIAIDGVNSLQRSQFVIATENPTSTVAGSSYEGHEYVFVNKKNIPIPIVYHGGASANVLSSSGYISEVPANTTMNIINVKNYSSEYYIVLSSMSN